VAALRRPSGAVDRAVSASFFSSCDDAPHSCGSCLDVRATRKTELVMRADLALALEMLDVENAMVHPCAGSCKITGRR